MLQRLSRCLDLLSRRDDILAKEFDRIPWSDCPSLIMRPTEWIIDMQGHGHNGELGYRETPSLITALDNSRNDEYLYLSRLLQSRGEDTHLRKPDPMWDAESILARKTRT